MNVPNRSAGGRARTLLPHLALVGVLVLGACGGSTVAPSVSPSSAASPSSAVSPSVIASPSAADASAYADFAMEACGAFALMQRAIGNPDTGQGSELSNQLEAAVAAGDREGAAQAAAGINAELEAGRQQAAMAARYPPAARMMTAFDRFLAAYQALVANEVKRAGGASGARDSQQVFEEAGGVDSWSEMLAAYQELMEARPSGAPPYECPGVPMSF